MSKYKYVSLGENVEEMFIGPFGSCLKNECFVNEDEAYCMVYEQKHAIQKTMDVETRYVNEQKYNELKRFNIHGGDIIVSCRGTIGETFIVPADAPLGIMHPSIMKIRLKDGVYDKYYFNLLLMSRLKKHEAEANGSGIKMVISATELGKELFPVPTMEEQKEITDIISKISYVIEKRKQELSDLDELIKSRFVEMFGMPGTDTFGWGLVTLGSVCSINPKKNQDSRLVSGTKISFVPMPAVTERGAINTNIIKEYDEVKTGFTYFAENDVLFAKITPCMENGKGAVAKGLHNGIGFGSTEFHVLRPISGKTDTHWIYTLTAFSKFRVDAASNMTGSAGQRRVPASFLANYRVSLPPLPLQEQFADFVKQVDKSKLHKFVTSQYDILKEGIYNAVIQN